MKKTIFTLLVVIALFVGITTASNKGINLDDDYKTISQEMNMDIEENPGHYELYIYILNDLASDSNRDIMFRIKMLIIMCTLTV